MAVRDGQGGGRHRIVPQKRIRPGRNRAGNGEGTRRTLRFVLVRPGQRHGKIAEQAHRFGPALGEVQGKDGEQAADMRAGGFDAAPGRAELTDKRAPRGGFVEPAIGSGGMAGDPLRRGQGVVGRAWVGGSWCHQTQMPAGEGRCGAERDGLLADQPVEIEGAPVTRRRRSQACRSGRA